MPPKPPTRIQRPPCSIRKPPPKPAPAPAPAPTPASNGNASCCTEPNIRDDGEGHNVCRNCFTQVSESNIVSDVQFSEDSRGAATVQGGFVGEHSRHARTLNSAAYRRVGGSDRNPAQEAESTARRVLAGLCPALGIADNIMNQAIQLYMLASQSNFSAGRKTDEVVGACLYAACRRTKENQVLLIDISELQHINVFRLGEVYKALCKELYLGIETAGAGVGPVGTQYLVEVESLIMKYCRKLEFGDKTRDVAADAARIVKRMKRDWMVTGRHPAGLCGACIILAARMNNFRRSIREVVYIAKVADATIAKRVEEFKRTASASLTVEQFREFGLRLKVQHDPPALEQTKKLKQKFEQKKRKRQEGSQAPSPVEITDDDVVTVDGTPPASATPAENPEEQHGRRKRRKTTSGAAQRDGQSSGPQYDADGFAIPALPNGNTARGTQDGTSTEETRPATGGKRKRAQPQTQQTAQDHANEEETPEPPAKRKRGRPKKQKTAPVVITEGDLIAEAALEQEMQDMLNDDDVEDARIDAAREHMEQVARATAEREKRTAAEQSKARREPQGLSWPDDDEPREEVTAAELEAEFRGDPEVENCVLPDRESRIKEQIWISHNEDWMRQQVEKALMCRVAKDTGTDGRGRKVKPGGGRGGVRKRGKKGAAAPAAGEDSTQGTMPTTPAEAVANMIESKPGGFSRFLNYEALQKVFGRPGNQGSGSGSGAGTQSGASDASATPGGPEASPAGTAPASARSSLEPDTARDSQARGREPSAPAGNDGDGEEGDDDGGDDDDLYDEHGNYKHGGDGDQDSQLDYGAGLDDGPDEDDEDYLRTMGALDNGGVFDDTF